MNLTKTKLSAFQLAMLTVAYVASIRAYSMMAEYGFSCLFYYLTAALIFLLPTALVSAELATTLPERGGVYAWVKAALGPGWGFLAIWLQFLMNIISLPVFLSFIAATFSYIFMPQLASNKYFLILFILIVFWLATFISFTGMKTAGWINTFGVVVGTFIPTTIILTLSIVWLFLGDKSQVVVSASTFFPNFHHLHMQDLVFLAGLLYSMTGMEISGAHALDVKNPGKSYPKGIFLSAIFIALLGFGAVSIAIVVPQKDLSLIAGIMQAFTIFLNKFHLHWAVPVVAFMIVIGAIAALNSSIIGPSKGLFGAATGGEIPPFLTKVNDSGMPINMFVFQGIVISIISMIFLLMPSVNSSYWLMAVIAIVLYLSMYVLLFISVIVLRYKRPHVTRPYKIPGGKIGLWIVAGTGLLSAVFGIIISFFPPVQIQTGGILRYEFLLLLGISVLVGVGFLIYLFRQPHWAITIED